MHFQVYSYPPSLKVGIQNGIDQYYIQKKYLTQMIIEK